MFKKLINFCQKFIASVNTAERIERTFELKIRANHLLNSTLNSKGMITRDLSDSETPTVVSLTTYSKRIHEVHLTIESISEQTIKPHRVVLWLDEEEFTFEQLPILIRKQVERGLEIRFCKNLRSYKKLIPSLQSFPDSNLILIDDDILYPHDLIELLLIEHEKFPGVIVGHRAHKVTFDSQGNIKPYRHWGMESSSHEVDRTTFITTGGGTFVPRGVIDPSDINIEMVLELCPNADDIWFKAFCLKHNIPCKKVKDDRDFRTRFISVESVQDIGLKNENYFESGNDLQLVNIFDYFRIKNNYNTFINNNE
ncbi:glycosyl transferase [Thalassotalea sp. PS06]|uniref:glycosyl transferase n=1 Tax=Thalassotalea sp. PS06 TaxID=2594005 RepID=UPI001162B20F|nr:glycosyl transferase [Thalassotalea sp. PS06]QDP01988.1 glycosyl transferase [Thalassotalea sp. PS06]